MVNLGVISLRCNAIMALENGVNMISDVCGNFLNRLHRMSFMAIARVDKRKSMQLL